MAQFHNELTAVQQTSGTLHLRNRNLSDRGLQDASPTLQENELATVSKTQQNTGEFGTWDTFPAAGVPSLHVPPGVRHCPPCGTQYSFLLWKTNSVNREKL